MIDLRDVYYSRNVMGVIEELQAILEDMEKKVGKREPEPTPPPVVEMPKEVEHG